MSVRTRRTAVVATLILLGLAREAGAADGAALYKAHCALCHGNGPAPRFAGKSADDVRKAIAEVKAHQTRQIPLEADGAAAVAAFVADQPSMAVVTTPAPNPAARQRVARGDELAAAGDNQAALFAYLDAANLDPRSVEARLRLAAQYSRMGRPERAREQWEIALALDPGNAEAARGLERKP